MELKILHLYHDIMDLYGDKGNMMTIKYRCEQRGIKLVYDTCTLGQEKDYSSYDLVFMGGGADKEQLILSKDLLSRKSSLANAIEKGTFFLLICGGYQLFGQYYVNADGHKIEGLGFFDYVTEKSKSNNRCIGNIYLDVEIDGERFDVLGFENHGGQTYGNDESYFGKVIFGNGNYYGAKSEGFYKDNVLGTYIHGPLLPKNPALSDFIIRKSLLKNHGKVNLEKLDDTIEVNAKVELLENLGHKRIITDWLIQEK